MAEKEKEIKVVDRQNYGNKYLKRGTYKFLANEPVVPITVYEAPSAAVHYPIVFTKDDNGYHLGVLMGLFPKSNLFVSQDGKFLGKYVPAIVTAYPFKIANIKDSNKAVLCIEEPNDFVTEEKTDFPFFNEDGTHSERLKAMLEFLNRLQTNFLVTNNIIEKIEECDLIVPLDIKVKISDMDRTIKGLYQVSEKALNELDDDKFLELRKIGGLSLIYCHLVSLNNFTFLKDMLNLKLRVDAPQQNTTFKNN